MTLDDFERELANEAAQRKQRKRSRSRSPNREDSHRRKHHRDHTHSHHRSSRHGESKHDKHHDRKRHRRSKDEEGERRSRRDPQSAASDKNDEGDGDEEDEWVEKGGEVSEPKSDANASNGEAQISGAVKRDAWMQPPSALDVDYVQRKQKRSPPAHHVRATEKDVQMKIHDKELNRGLLDPVEPDSDVQVPEGKPAQREVDYTFGDSGSSWRMTKLRAVFEQAKKGGRTVEELAVERYGDLRTFDEAREEEVELDRRKMYGEGYVGKEKPSGEFFQERKLNSGIKRNPTPDNESEDEFEAARAVAMEEKSPPATTVPLDQTALNKLKAQMMRAKLKGGPEAARLEAEYSEAMAAAANRKQPDVVVLNKMEARELAGGRKGEVKSIDNKRGRERRLVKENEDMSIDDMVRHEKRTKGQYSNEGKAFAERIAKDVKFDNDLDYMDENAVKLSKSVPKSDINLRNTSIENYHKTKHILDTCPLCHHEDTNTPPQAPLVSLATRVYLTLPTSPEITPYGLCTTIVPIEHRLNLLECDDDEWEEMRNFMKALSRFYYAQKPPLSVVFYENAAHAGRRRHASLEAVPLPLAQAETAPAFFREAILAADEEWTQHRKIIDTGARAADGLGKLAFRRSMVSELPYFHVWFTLDGGLGHVVEDARRWPKGDLFAREVLGGMLDVGAEVIRKQGRWRKGDAEMQARVEKLKKGWDKFDWTHVLMDAQ